MMSVSDWNIEGMAASIARQMRKDNADVSAIDEYLEDDFYTIVSRDPAAAHEAIAQVESLVKEMLKGGIPQQKEGETTG